MGQTATILDGYGAFVERPLHFGAGGLAVVASSPGRYTVTHLESGKAIWPRTDLYRSDNVAAALRALGVALASGLDWIQDEVTLGPAWEMRGRDILHRMQLAAYPPRRANHVGHQRRRRLPFEAQSKIKALRESRELGLPWLWPDLDAYRRRGELWGVLPFVQRQPCTRFGVTRESREVI